MRYFLIRKAINVLLLAEKVQMTSEPMQYLSLSLTTNQKLITFLQLIYSTKELIYLELIR